MTLYAVYFCIRDQHDLRLVVLAGLICVAASLGAVSLYRRSRTADEKTRWRWTATAGLATGGGIWATHFVAMLGYDPGVVAGYHAGLTAASLLIAVSMTTAGLAIARLFDGLRALIAAAVAVGGGIAAMHYTGMMAVRFPGVFAWNPAFVIASIIFAIAPLIPALAAAARPSRASGVLAALLIVAAILALHFTGMAAVQVLPGEGEIAGLMLSPVTLGLAIAATTLSLLAVCTGAAILSRQAQAKIRASEREFRLLVQGISDCAIYMLDPEGRVVSWNAGAERLKGYTVAEAVGLPLERFYSPEERLAGAPRDGLEAATIQGRLNAEGWRYRKDGSRFWAHVTIERVNDEAGALKGFAKITRDMTRFKEDQDQLAAATANLDAALANMRQGLQVFDADERLVLMNDRTRDLFGLPRESCPPGTHLKDALREGLALRAGGPVDEAVVEDAYARHLACVREDGGQMIVDYSDNLVLSVAMQPMPGGGWVVTYDDITERRRSEARIAHMALHDGLTGLPNRVHFNERLDAEIQRATRLGGKLGVIAMDLDRFKEINDTRGHAAGDALLNALAARLSGVLEGDEFIARLGGDEFAAFKLFQDDADLEGFAERLEACVRRPFQVDEAEIISGASIGIAVFPNDGEAREQVFNNADLAMYRAKSLVGQHICYYEQGMDDAARARRLLANDLREAIRRDELSVAYQVQRSVTSGEITGYEALLRWNHPRDGWVPPDEFIPIAEENGEILNIGEWVLRRACADAAGWDAPHKVAVNLSAVQLMHVDLAGVITRILLETGLPAHRLELEITETAIVTDKLRALHVLRQIKALGVTVAIDDFGTGYSSLDTLNAFPFDKIKIDKSFLLESENSQQAQAIIRAVLALGRSLGVPVLAEGLESEAQLRLLKAEGCDEAQGYLFGRPQSPQMVEKVVAV